ncbi:MAG: MerR family transcriptional regulator [Sandaracinaceae bacterium]|nr:MerR family transcriptional regulator [Sandaracinaceae bacterium]
MPQENSYRVGMVAKLTGLSPHTLRTWERRYDAVVPERTEAGGRLYSEDDIQRLRLLRDLVDAGHAIGTVARLSGTELARMSAVESQAAHATPPETPVEEFLDAVERLDVASAQAVLSRAAITLPAERLLLEVVAPSLRAVGERWERGELRIAHERVATAAARGLLFGLTRLYPPREGLGVVVAAAPRGERHELGALMVAMLAALRGFTVLYLGADVPEAEIAFVASVRPVSVVLLSVVNLSPAEVREVARVLSAGLPRSTRLIFGGPASLPLPDTRAERLEDLKALDVLLRSMAP